MLEGIATVVAVALSGGGWVAWFRARAQNKKDEAEAEAITTKTATDLLRTATEHHAWTVAELAKVHHSLAQCEKRHAEDRSLIEQLRLEVVALRGQLAVHVAKDAEATVNVLVEVPDGSEATT